MRFKAILFDCDGVLIDSEAISCGVNAAFMREHGYDVSLEDFLLRHMGHSRPQILADAKERSGIDFVPIYATGEIDRRQSAAFHAELRACEGVADFLSAVDVPVAVASGSSSARLALTLDIAGLSAFFGEHVYSAEMVARGKPAPDVFLHAAEKLGVLPEDCLVIEDGVHGIHAAHAAGMEVWAYLGGSHIFPRLRAEILDAKPVFAFDCMREISAFLTQVRAA